MRSAVLLAWAFLLACPTVARAHGRRAAPDTWWLAWNWDPLVLLTLGFLGAVYVRGLRRLWAQVGWGCKVRHWQAASYFAALFLIGVALLSPLDALSEELSSLHMVQHMILISAAAPLFVIGSPALVLAWGLPEIWQGKGFAIARFVFRLPNASLLWHPLLLCGLFALTLWAWHHPTLYQTALRDPLAHDAQHLSFFIVACLFWRVGLDPFAGRRLSPMAAIPYFFATSIHSSVLGVFLALSPRVWYEDYVPRTVAFGLTPLEDQQLAGFLMWMPACLTYPFAAAILFGGWLAGVRLSTPRRLQPLGTAITGE